MFRKICFVITGFMLFTGCTIYHIDSRSTTLDFYPPKDSPAQVAYLEKVDKPYEEIGIVNVITERTHSLDEIIAKMKYEAAVLGGDAITDIQTDATGMWKRLNPPDLLKNAYIHANYSAKVVVFK